MLHAMGPTAADNRVQAATLEAARSVKTAEQTADAKIKASDQVCTDE